MGDSDTKSFWREAGGKVVATLAGMLVLAIWALIVMWFDVRDLNKRMQAAEDGKQIPLVVMNMKLDNMSTELNRRLGDLELKLNEINGALRNR